MLHLLGGALSAQRRTRGLKKRHMISAAAVVGKVTPIIDGICVHTVGGAAEDVQTVAPQHPELKRDSNSKGIKQRRQRGQEYPGTP